ncbi:hypothetical protein [Halosegnis marinus]|uniref:Uncharacterized protein n=1 Tax=Halosegnis marinus TaxID=3034023 RepID=A0ABD5ZM63_9EURY|nr:hypothetical protein [Halosegnis sp. DT85]
MTRPSPRSTRHERLRAALDGRSEVVAAGTFRKAAGPTTEIVVDGEEPPAWLETEIERLGMAVDRVLPHGETVEIQVR